MKRILWGKMAAGVACLGMVMPSSVLASAPSGLSHDVALRSGGVLVGQVVTPQGTAKVNSMVSVRQGEHEVVRTTTDENGVFAAQGLRGGSYQIRTEDGQCDCRLWAADTAPPAARPAALIVSGDEVVRGQGPVQSWVGWMRAHPYITAGVVAASIAVPLAFIDNDDDDNGS